MANNDKERAKRNFEAAQQCPYDPRPQHNPSDATKIVNAVLYDLNDRRGIKQELGEVDDEVRAEIMDSLTSLVQAGLDNVTEVKSDQPQLSLEELRRQNERVNEFFYLCAEHHASEDLTLKYYEQVKEADISPMLAVEEIMDAQNKSLREFATRSVVPFYNAAEQASLRDDLSKNEACHATAHCIYAMVMNGDSKYPRMPESFSAAKVYGDLYDRRKKESIQAKLARPASELFT